MWFNNNNNNNNNQYENICSKPSNAMCNNPLVIEAIYFK